MNRGKKQSSYDVSTSKHREGKTGVAMRALLVIAAITMPQAAKSQAQARLGVFNLRVAGLDQNLAAPSIDALATALGRLNVGEILTAQELNALIDAERRADALGCNDVSCLIEVGAAAGVDRLVVGSLTRVAESLVVSLQLVDITGAKVINRVTLKWAGQDSEFTNLLGAAAELLALAATARVPGTITLSSAPSGSEWWIGQQRMDSATAELDVGVYSIRVEAMGYKPLRKQVIVRTGQTTVVDASLVPSAAGDLIGIGLHIGALVPLRKSYRSTRPGMSFDLAYWLELDLLAVQPRFGLRWDVAAGEETSYLELVADISANWLFLRSSITPFAGLGIGGRWVKTKRPETVVLGTIITTRHRSIVEEAGFGVGGYGRLGVLFFRDKPVRSSLTVDYNIAYIEGGRRPRAVQISLGFVF